VPSPKLALPTPQPAARARLEKDPFLSLLEQLAENENSQGGPSELEFFLTGTGAVEAETEIPLEKDGTS
jgi:hypothetical protein